MIVYKLLLDKNTWNLTTVCKLFVFDKNIWYIKYVQTLLNNYTKNVDIIVCMQFPNLEA